MNILISWIMIFARFLMVIAPRPVALTIAEYRLDYINPRWNTAILADNQSQCIFWYHLWMDTREDMQAIHGGYLRFSWRKSKA